jgi:hypothetical protein
MEFEDMVGELTREKDSNSRDVSRGGPKWSWILREGVKVDIIEYISTTDQDRLEMIISNDILALGRGSRPTYKKEKRSKCAYCGRNGENSPGDGVCKSHRLRQSYRRKILQAPRRNIEYINGNSRNMGTNGRGPNPPKMSLAGVGSHPAIFRRSPKRASNSKVWDRV